MAVMRPLPPFPELVAFEAVARHLSFTRAAAELCLTQSAVSHRVRRLEAHFGKRLIHRLNPGLKLTEAGAALLPEITAALDGLARLSRSPERRLRVAAGSALCTWWLAGRLPAFMARCPGLSVELTPLDSYSTPVPEVDVRILWVSEAEYSPGPTQAPLFAERVFPVCSPRLLPGGRPFADPRALGNLTLLHKATLASGEWSWNTWLDRLGIDARHRRGGQLRFADMGPILSAALDGAGVGLARSLLVHDALHAGRLTIPVLGFEPMTSEKKHVARWRRGRADDPDIAAFVGWMVEEAALSMEQTDDWLRSQLRDAHESSREAMRETQRTAG
jgi:LysR family glycine cleavage system transcriptional activator